MPRPTLTAAAHTDVGLVRSGNEDFYVTGDDFALVADGLGGHAGGEVASRTALEMVATHLRAVPVADRTLSTVRRAVLAGHEAVLAAAHAKPALAGMATTLTGLVMTRAGLAVVNVGDSRTYQLTRDGMPNQLTRDDSLVADLVDAGAISADFAPFHPKRNIITAALGLSEEDLGGRLPVTVRHIPDPAGRYVICSDGLSDVVGENGWYSHMARLSAHGVDAHQATLALIDLALAGGGRDNITVIVADVAA